MNKRTQTRAIKVGSLTIGGFDNVIIQSMTNTPTKDIEATVSQINQLAGIGCQLIRVAVLDEQDALAIKQITERISIPLVADIHFNYRLALLAIENGAAKVRINPGNIGSEENVKAVVEKCREYGIPIRIGINSGSLEKELYEKYGRCCPEAMIESAQKHIDILEDLDFHDICLSFKSSNVPITIDTYRLAAERWNYPLHLGLTEAGTKDYSLIKSSAALGALLHEGIGDTLRISISDDCRHEVEAAKKLLKAFDLIHNVPDLISCPTCGRTQYDVLPLMKEMEEFLTTVHADIKVAVMGCAVNGPGEARDADIGVAGGYKEALLFRHGEIIRKIPQDEISSVLKREILALASEMKQS
ncbi:MAG: flavodoxin-dependent (E)-4-hydroxy-3-methylbut-2-enyl-diphosphate synthase [Erysipelotrichaceae bacterium]|nr:flavodoxin-dependent (E)-4-hydroxy-3-methylbut-2-enyl-diphosphate synthase [Erysipelotrichaceae bacterium]